MNSLEAILKEAWKIRQATEPVLLVSAPGAKRYNNKYYINYEYSFMNLSVTGENCACHCEHCKGKLLETMVPTTTPEEMNRIIDRLAAKRSQGILISGGANNKGEVPLLGFLDSMAYAKEKGLKVIVHSGLIKRSAALALKEVGIDQVLIDIIGDERTIRNVYHLDRKPSDYLESMLFCREVGLNLAPHVVIGLHFGDILGEYKALEMISEAQPQAVVMVIITPTCGTGMQGVIPPDIDEVGKVIGTARILNPNIPLTLGCARPTGEYKRQVEIMAVDCGVNAIAYPDENTIEYASSKGLKTVFSQECCSLIGTGTGYNSK
ncbi:MAG: radical SAM protein [Syntrophomonas sp.]